MRRRLIVERAGGDRGSQRQIILVSFRALLTIAQALFHFQAPDQIQGAVEITVNQVLSILTTHFRPPGATDKPSLAASRLRARARRDITVPSGRSARSAISLYDRPSNSRRITTSRYSTGNSSRACMRI